MKLQLVMKLGLGLVAAELGLSAPTGSLVSTATSLLDPVEVFLANARNDGLTNLHVFWPTIETDTYNSIRSNIGTWTAKGARFMYLHDLIDGNGIKAVAALPRTPTWNKWLNRVEGEYDFGIVSIVRGNGHDVLSRLDGIFKVRPQHEWRFDMWYLQKAQSLHDLHYTRILAPGLGTSAGASRGA